MLAKYPCFLQVTRRRLADLPVPESRPLKPFLVQIIDVIIQRLEGNLKRYKEPWNYEELQMVPVVVLLQINWSKTRTESELGELGEHVKLAWSG